MPITVGDSYTRSGAPFTFVEQVQGAWITVETESDLNNIIAANTKTGQVVLVKDTETLYRATTTVNPTTFEPEVSWSTFAFRGENDIFVYQAFNVYPSSSEGSFPNDIEFFYNYTDFNTGVTTTAEVWSSAPATDSYIRSISTPSDFPLPFESVPKIAELSFVNANNRMRFQIENSIASSLGQSWTSTPLMFTFWVKRQEFFDNFTEGIGSTVGPWMAINNPDYGAVRNLFLYKNGISTSVGEVKEELYNPSTGTKMRSKVVYSQDGWDMISIEIDEVVKGSVGIVTFELEREVLQGTSNFTGARTLQIGNIQLFTEIFDPLPKTIYYKLSSPFNPEAAANDLTSILTRVTELEEAGGGSYGAKIANYLHKLRSWKMNQRLDAADRNPMIKEPKMIFLGDSITSGQWSVDFKDYLTQEYLLSSDAIKIIQYGGYPIERFLPNIDSLVLENPDLIIFNEFDPVQSSPVGANSLWDKIFLVENYIKILKECTSADIAIGTWSVAENDLNAFANNEYRWDGITLGQFSFQEQLDLYRGVAAKFNCELIDFNMATFDYAAKNGIEAFADVTNFPHLNEDLYTAIFIPEIKKHFKTWDAVDYANGTYGNEGKQELVMFQDSIRFQGINTGSPTVTGSAIKYGSAISSDDVSFSVSYDAKNIIGFDVIHLYESAGTGEMSLTIDSVAPSSLEQNGTGSVLQYVTEVVSTTYTTHFGSYDWRTKRPLMQGYVSGNILDNDSLISGQYTIDVVGLGIAKSTSSGSPNSTIVLDGDYTSGTNGELIQVVYEVEPTSRGISSYSSSTDKTTIPSIVVTGDASVEFALSQSVNIFSHDANDNSLPLSSAQLELSYNLEAEVTSVSYDSLSGETTIEVQINGDQTSVLGDFYIGSSYANVTASSSYDGVSDETTVTVPIVFGSVISSNTVITLLDKDNKQKVLCEIKDPSAVSLSKFIVGYSGTITLGSQGTGGSIVFEQTWNGEPNFYLASGELDSFGEPALSRFFLDDSYEFYVKNNWIDTIKNNVDRECSVFGLKRGDYTIELSRNTGNCKVLGILLHR